MVVVCEEVSSVRPINKLVFFSGHGDLEVGFGPEEGHGQPQDAKPVQLGQNVGLEGEE